MSAQNIPIGATVRVTNELKEIMNLHFTVKQLLDFPFHRPLEVVEFREIAGQPQYKTKDFELWIHESYLEVCN